MHGVVRFVICRTLLLCQCVLIGVSLAGKGVQEHPVPIQLCIIVKGDYSYNFDLARHLAADISTGGDELFACIVRRIGLLVDMVGSNGVGNHRLFVANKHGYLFTIQRFHQCSRKVSCGIGTYRTQINRLSFRHAESQCRSRLTRCVGEYGYRWRHTHRCVVLRRHNSDGTAVVRAVEYRRRISLDDILISKNGCREQCRGIQRVVSEICRPHQNGVGSINPYAFVLGVYRWITQIHPRIGYCYHTRPRALNRPCHAVP